MRRGSWSIAALLALAPLARAQAEASKEVRPESVQVILQSVADGSALDPRQVGQARQLDAHRLAAVFRLEGLTPFPVPAGTDLTVELEARWPLGPATDIGVWKAAVGSGGAYQLAAEPWGGKLLAPMRYRVRVRLVVDQQAPAIHRHLQRELGTNDTLLLVARDVRLGDEAEEVRFHGEEHDACRPWLRRLSDLAAACRDPAPDVAAILETEHRRFRTSVERLVTSPAWPVHQAIEGVFLLLRESVKLRVRGEEDGARRGREAALRALSRAEELLRARRDLKAALQAAEHAARTRASDARVEAARRPARLDLGGTTLEVQLPPGFERRKLGQRAALVGPRGSGAIVYGQVSLAGLGQDEAWALLDGLFPDGNLRRVQKDGQTFLVVELPIDGRDLALRRAYLRPGEGHVLWFMVAAPAKQGFEDVTQGLEGVMGRARLTPGAADPEPEPAKAGEEEAPSAEDLQLRELIDGLPDVGERLREKVGRSGRRERPGRSGGPAFVTDVPWAGPSVTPSR